MQLREFDENRLKNIHTITEEEMSLAVIGDTDKSKRDKNYGYLYDYNISKEYKNVVYDLLEGCLHNYNKYQKDQVFSLKTADLKSEIFFEIDQPSLAHIYGITQSVMNPKSDQTKNFLEKAIPNYRFARTPVDKLTLMVQNKDKIIEYEQKVLNDKSIFNYPKMFVKLSGMVSLKNPEENVHLLAEKNKNVHASKDERFKYFLSFKSKQPGKYNSTTIELTLDDNPYMRLKETILSPKSARRDNDALLGKSALFMINQPIKNRTIEYNKAHPERQRRNERTSKTNKLNNMRNTIQNSIHMRGDVKDELSRRTNRQK